MSADASAAMQWHNAEVCLDVQCSCGAELHLDGDTPGQVRCPRCLVVWVLELTVRRRQSGDFPHEPTMLEDDEDR